MGTKLTSRLSKNGTSRLSAAQHLEEFQELFLFQASQYRDFALRAVEDRKAKADPEAE